MSTRLKGRRQIRGYVQVAPGTKMSRRCPTCDAAPGHRCGRWTGLDSMIWKTYAAPHRER